MNGRDACGRLLARIRSFGRIYAWFGRICRVSGRVYGVDAHSQRIYGMYERSQRIYPYLTAYNGLDAYIVRWFLNANMAYNAYIHILSHTSSSTHTSPFLFPRTTTLTSTSHLSTLYSRIAATALPNHRRHPLRQPRAATRPACFDGLAEGGREGRGGGRWRGQGE